MCCRVLAENFQNSDVQRVFTGNKDPYTRESIMKDLKT